jgi:uncharacterized protein YoxC
MLIVSIILIIVSILILVYAIYQIQHTHKYNQDIDKQNKLLEQDYEAWTKKVEKEKNQYFSLSQQVNSKQNEINSAYTQLENIRQATDATIADQKKISQQAFENYCEILDKQYKEQEEEYNGYIDSLVEAYAKLQFELMDKAEAAREELAQVEATRAAAIQAQLKEKEIKEQLAFYCLTIKQNDLNDIKVLDSIKPRLNNPRILSMLIWQTYFQKPMTSLCNNIVGTKVKCGIYKITNQLDDMCYIGQSVDIATRWKDHAKCGLGIDTPQNNKLYQAMIKDGLWNFSFEILEECPREQLNEKEKYYIQLYQSKEYGYNTTAGNK